MLQTTGMKSDMYTGQLIGGPGDGNMVTATVPEFKMVAWEEMWLDGEGPTKSPIITSTEGKYVWDENVHYFRWNLSKSESFTNKRTALI